MSKTKKNRNWANVQVALSQDDTVYLLGIIGADIGAMKAAGVKYSDVVLERAARTRQKLQNALRNRSMGNGTGKDKAVAVSD